MPELPDEPPPDLRGQLWRQVGPQALLVAVVGGAVAALVGRLASDLRVAGGIVLCAAALAVGLSWWQRRPRRHLLAAAAAVLAAAGAAVLAAAIVDHRSRGVRSEEALVASLSAGEDVGNFTSALGPPTTRRPTPGGLLLYQWERPRATLQAAVTRSGVVRAYAVYAKVPDFHPRLRHGIDVTLNETLVDQRKVGAAADVAANLYCGAHKAGYFQLAGGFGFRDGRWFVLGLSNAESTRISVAPVCQAIGEGLSTCPQLADNALDVYRCVAGLATGRRLLATARASSYVETAPGVGVTPDMLYPPDDAAGLPG